MAERRMFARDILKSSVMCKLAELNPEKELEAQRVFEVLILFADDYGRGRVVINAIKAEAFGGTPNTYAKVTNEDIVKWLETIKKEGAIEIYQVGNQQYYQMTGWAHYQRGKWYKKDSNIPDKTGAKKITKKGNEEKQYPDTGQIKL